MDNFCVWAPWVFSFLAFCIGWLLRKWYDHQRFEEMNENLERKDNDMYHLNEAHTLLQKDKKTKLSSLTDELRLKDRIIGEQKKELLQLKRSDAPKKPTASITEQSEVMLDQPLDPNSIVSIIDRRARERKVIVSDQKVATQKILPADLIEGGESIKKAKSKSSKVQRKVKKIKRLIKERDLLRDKIAKLEQQGATKTITITETILVTEKINKKKLRKSLRNLPIKRTKKVISRKSKVS